MTDAQSRAFRDATPDEWQESTLADNEHGTLDDLDPDGARRSVEEYEAAGWDAERTGPKTVDEARESLAARIADPSAPDTEDEAGAYGEQGA